MLLQFSVENFKSIKHKAVLSMEASADNELENNYVIDGKNKNLKVAVIFGANAAGKSNIFLALTTAILAVRRSNDRQVGEPILNIVPFKFDKDTIVTPTSFEFVFSIDGVKYVYGFSATIKKIVREYLYVYNTAKATTIFERDETAAVKYRFTIPSLKSQLAALTERNTENKLFLATATAWNCEETRIPLLWFMEGINTYSPSYADLLRKTGDMFENDQDSSLRKFTNRILREADISIDDFELESKVTKAKIISTIASQDSPVDVSGFPEIEQKEYRINTIHNIINNNNVKSTYKIGLNEESKGTINLFFFSPIIKRAFEIGEILCIDEFDTSLHPMLVLYLVGLFNNPEVNKSNAQLIISTHTTALLSLKELRRDQIYFIEKDQKSGISELYSLDEFSPRTREDICKAYMLGRYGSIPKIREGTSLCQ